MKLYCILFIFNYLSATIINLTSALTSFIITALKVIVFWYIDIMMGRDVYDLTRMIGALIQIIGIFIYFGLFDLKEKTKKKD